MTEQSLLTPKNKTKRLSTPWRSRIVSSGEADPAELIGNPLNWRLHPTGQAKALSSALGEIGWVAGVTVNQGTATS
jgi:hypothetical protein